MTENQPEKKKLFGLTVDDEEAILELTADEIKATGLVPLRANNPRDAMLLIEKHSRELAIVLSDYAMPGCNGLEFRKMMLDEYKDIPFVVVSGAITKDMALSAVELKVSAFVAKPFSEDELQKTINLQAKERIETIEERNFLQDLFIQESMEILEDLEDLLLALEDNPSDEDTINTIFRLVHTIKGSSGVIEIEELTAYVHAFEDVLSAIKEKKCVASKKIIGVLINAFDRTRKIVSSVADGTFNPKGLAEEGEILRNSIYDDSPAAQTAGLDESTNKNEASASNRPAGYPKKDGILVPRSLLDEFMAISGEITVIRNMVNKSVAALERKLPGDVDVSVLGDLLEEMHKINTSMQGQITELRKVPMAQVLKKLPRTVRDLAKSLNKEVSFKVQGDELRVDTAISQALSNSLIHMVRNCVDHGLENTEVRLKNGKEKCGHIAIVCTGDDQDVKVRVIDDGGGIDPNVIARKAIEKGLVSEGEVQEMSRQKILSLIFEPGFSTAAKVTDVSGRGVGMDMVKSSVTDLGGKLDVDSELGRGTTISMTLPIPKSVVIIQSLIVKAGKADFAIPQDDVLRLVKLEHDRRSEMVRSFEGGEVVRVDGKHLPLICLAKIMGTESDVIEGASPIDHDLVVLRSELGEFALIVDSILDSEDVVVKPVMACVDKNSAYKGATFMGDGGVGLILDIAGIARLANLSVDVEEEKEEKASDVSTLENEVLIMDLGLPENYAISLDQINRLEVFDKQLFQNVGGVSGIVYRGAILPIVDLSAFVKKSIGMEIAPDQAQSSRRVVVVPTFDGLVGLAIEEIVDVVYSDSALLAQETLGEFFEGAMILGEKTITKLNLANILTKCGYKPAEIVRTEEDNVEEVKEETGITNAPIEEPELDMAAGWGLF